MKNLFSRIKAHLCMLAITLVVSTGGSKTLAEGARDPTFVVDSNTMIRFFLPQSENYLRPALVFRVASQGDRNWGTAPIIPIGRTPYISLAEMKALADGLSHSNLKWRMYPRAQEVMPFKQLPITHKMEVTIFTSSNTVSSDLSPKKICPSLASLNMLITTPRARWELQAFRRMYGCKVEDFNPSAYPDHY